MPSHPPWTPQSEGFNESDPEHWYRYHTGPLYDTLRAGETPRRPKESWKDRQPLNYGEAAYSKPDTYVTWKQEPTILSRHHYEMLVREGHIEWLLNNNIRVEPTRWPAYLLRVTRHLLGIDHSPRRG